MYDILAYLFENCQRAELAHERERVAQELAAAGFEDADISEALHWIAGVLRTPQVLAAMPDARASFRAFAARELAKLDARCCGYLLSLERSGILDPQARELVLERALAAAGEELTLEQLKLVVLMVLWSRQSEAGARLAADILGAPASARPS